MNNIELHVKQSADINYTRLDLFKDETITLTKVIQDAKDPGKIFTDFTKSFNLPASKTNNKFFKHFENFTQSVEFSFDARRKVEAKIELNSLPFQRGSLRLEGVKLKNGRPDTYKVTFFGSQSLKNVLGEYKIADLDWLTNFDTTYTSANIKTGFGTGGTGSVSVDSVTYTAPLVTALISNNIRGFYSSDQTPDYYNTSTQEVNKTGGNLRPGNTEHSGYYWKDLTFSIRLYVIIKAIENSNITRGLIKFSTDFFNTTNLGFYNLYMLCQRNAGKILDGTGSSYTPNQQSNKGYINGTLAADHELNLVLRQSTFEIYNLSSSQNFQFVITANFGTVSDNIRAEITNISTNNIEYATWTPSQSGGQRSYQLGNGTYNIKFLSDSSAVVTSFSLSFIDTFDTNTSTTVSTSNVDAGFTIPSGGFQVLNNIPDMKIIDFLTGLFKIFNLTASEKDGVITVDTLDDFYSGGTLRNITEFVDSTDKTVDKALPYREIVFKYEDTENILAKQHKEIAQSDWGSTAYNAGQELDSNNTTYEIVAPFQHMKFERLVDGSTTKNIQVGHLLDDKQEPYLGKPVIFYPIHSTNLGVTADGFNLMTEIQGYDGGSSDQDETISAYWVPSNSIVVQSASSGYSQNINFDSEINEWTNSADDNNDSLFKTYYQSYIVNIFRYNERLTKIKARLPLKFLQHYTLADELQISDLTYRINSITTNLQTGESSLELLNGRETVATTGATSISIDISTSSNSTPATACGYTLNNTVHYSGVLGNGTQLYTNSTLTTTFSGTGNNYAFPGSYYAAIDSNGYISGYQPCPTLTPVISTSTSTNVTYNSFTANANLTVANGTISAKGFYIGTNAAYASNSTYAVAGSSTGTFSYNFTGASANTTYYVTAYATNGNGTSYGTSVGNTYGVTFNTNTSPTAPTVTAEPVDNLGETSFTAELEITADGGQTINGAGFYMGTNSSSATANTHYDISPAPTSIGTKQYDFTGLTGNTNYYYWGTATNTFSATKGVSSTYTQVTTNAAPNYTTHTSVRYHATDAYLACLSNTGLQTLYSSGTGNSFANDLVLYTNNGLTNLAANGYYSKNNKSYLVASNNGKLTNETACATSIKRLVFTTGYPTTSYTTTSAACSASLGSVYGYYTGSYNGGQLYTDTTLTTAFTGAGTQGYPQYLTPTQYIVKMKRQSYNGAYWADIGTNTFVVQVSTAGIVQLTYYDYNNNTLVCP